MFIADEIQTGFCRTGDWFACDHEGVVPDLVTTAKGIAGGLPLAAVTGRAEIMDAVHAGGLGGTYGGNPVACAAALGAIETMANEDLPGRARRIGDIMLPRLRKLAEAYPVIGDVRGRGAMIAIELVRPGTLEPDAATAGQVAKACHAAGLVVLTCGTFGNVLRFLPPLVIGEQLLDGGAVDPGGRLRHALTRLADDRGLKHRGVTVGTSLDLLGVDVLATADDEVLDPVHQRQVPILVEPADVAGVQPAAAQDLGRLAGPAEVAAHHVRPAHDHLTGLAGGSNRSWPSTTPTSTPGSGSPAVPALRVRMQRVERAADRAFRQAVACPRWARRSVARTL